MNQTWTEFETKAMLRAAGLPVTREREVDGLAEALQAAREVGYPVALKLSSRKYPHKTEAGGVRLGLDGPSALSAAWASMAPRFVGERFLVQAMVGSGVELIVGTRRDPTFGPIVLVGLGGVQVEVLGDVAIRACPVDEAEALAMLRELKAGPLLEAFRGRPAADRQAVAAFVAGLSRVAVERDDLAEIECNPVIARADGVIAVDALAVEAPRTGSAPKDRWAPGERVEGFFRPASVAVVGASDRPGKGGTAVLRNLLTHGFRGPVYAVHPTRTEVQGVAAFPSVAALPEPVDLVVAVVPRDAILAVVRDCGSRGVSNLIVVSGGFSDIGGEGREREAEVARAAVEAGVRLMGPNSIGTIDTVSGIVTSITTLGEIPGGGASYLGQTGVFSSGFASMLGPCPGSGMNKVACLGNKADVCESDVLAFYGADETTLAIGLYVEGVARPTAFLPVLRRVCAGKPVVVLKSGRSVGGARAMASHTGALAGDVRVFDAVARQAGAILAADFDEMFDLVKAFALAPLPAGNGLGVVSVSGVGCVLCADRAEAEGVVLPALSAATESRIRQIVPPWAPVRNPVDMWSAIEARGPEAAYDGIASAVLDQGDVHALLLAFVWIPESRFDLVSMATRLTARYPGKPITVVFLGGPVAEILELTRGLERIGIPVYPSISRAMRAVGAWERRRSWLSQHPR